MRASAVALPVDDDGEQTISCLVRRDWIPELRVAKRYRLMPRGVQVTLTLLRGGLGGQIVIVQLERRETATAR
jgi:hypothetical protein